ncbi:hypothetical protein AB0K00_32790 [Dactylosporangium sp. NPDC049525]|uniref:hypothetical protein n=1 Tax=Dactylosporangium sp. NPDC049525 TaxID=3154730 RepID=UPI00343728A1
MLWWISGGIVLLSLIVLGVAVMSTAARVRQFGNTALSLQRRLLDGEKRLQPHLARLQQTAEAMQPRLEAMQEQALIIQARRGELEDADQRSITRNS